MCQNFKKLDREDVTETEPGDFVLPALLFLNFHILDKHCCISLISLIFLETVTAAIDDPFLPSSHTQGGHTFRGAG